MASTGKAAMNDWYQPIDQQAGDSQDPAPTSQNYSGRKRYSQEPSNSNYESASQQGNPWAAADGHHNAVQQVSNAQGSPQDTFGQNAYTPQFSGTNGPTQIRLWQLQTSMSANRVCRINRKSRRPSWLPSWAVSAYATFIWVRPGVGSHSC